jgi:hypothetical protein
MATGGIVLALDTTVRAWADSLGRFALKGVPVGRLIIRVCAFSCTGSEVEVETVVPHDTLVIRVCGK